MIERTVTRKILPYCYVPSKSSYKDSVANTCKGKNNICGGCGFTEPHVVIKRKWKKKYYIDQK